jgi:YegS/Rv2252/BmrU family lipid kinase
VSELDRLAAWVAKPADDRPLIVAAGGDGTVGAAADMVAGTGAVLGILPLGTSNDVARSLRIPLRVEQAVELLRAGSVATVDLGQFAAPGAPPRHFVHAATLGLNVAFARMATQVSVRQRRGRLTYLAAAIEAWRRREPFRCTVTIEGRALSLNLLCLAVINAPIFGGRFQLRVSGSDVDDRLLDVLIIEGMALWRLVLASIPILLRARARVGGIRVLHGRRLQVEGEGDIDVSLDGEVVGRVPAHFALIGEALRAVVGPGFVDVDDPE